MGERVMEREGEREREREGRGGRKGGGSRGMSEELVLLVPAAELLNAEYTHHTARPSFFHLERPYFGTGKVRRTRDGEWYGP